MIYTNAVASQLRRYMHLTTINACHCNAANVLPKQQQQGKTHAKTNSITLKNNMKNFRTFPS